MSPMFSSLGGTGGMNIAFLRSCIGILPFVRAFFVGVCSYLACESPEADDPSKLLLSVLWISGTDFLPCSMLLAFSGSAFRRA